MAIAAALTDWPAYLFGPGHSSWNKMATAITPANAASVVQAWEWTPDPPILPGQPGSALLASPTVFRGRIFIGTNSGDFYALDAATGNVLWKRFIAFAPSMTCGAIGFTSTATVAKGPSLRRATVYVGAADGYLYALDAAEGSLSWRSLVAAPSGIANDYYIWSSPTVINGRIYIGVSSQCDNPLVQGGLRAFDQSTGALWASYDTVPNDSLGGSVWSSAAGSSRVASIWVTTGNEDSDSPHVGDSNSVVRLDSRTLEKQDIWTVPIAQQIRDGDFGASPTLFAARSDRKIFYLVGACNKNGRFYALNAMRLSEGPVWSFQVSAPSTGSALCLASAVWDRSGLYISGNETKIHGITYKGSVRRLDPVTGKPFWETGLPAQVVGTPALNGSGVLAVATWDRSANAAYLLNAATGTILATISTMNSPVFAQPVFADKLLLIASQEQGIHAYRPGP